MGGNGGCSGNESFGNGASSFSAGTGASVTRSGFGERFGLEDFAGISELDAAAVGTGGILC